MIVGCVKEIKKHEYRVGITPRCAQAYINAGHIVLIQKNAGEGASYSDQDYIDVGAEIITTPKDVFSKADMIVKVKEPQKIEYSMFKKGQILFTYLHLAADKEQTLALMEQGVDAIAYETIQKDSGVLPCLKPMSEIAGRLSIQEGAKYLETPFGGRGVLLGGVPGVKKGKVTIIGGGVVGVNAAQMAIGLGADVTILDVNADRLEYLDQLYFSRIKTLYSTRANILESIKDSDLVVGAVLIPGAKAPHLVKIDDLKTMKKGAVIVDVAVDQGGCVESTKPTTHDDPTFVVNNVVNYCVANMPGAVSRTSTEALTATTLKYGLEIATKGVKQACRDNVEIYRGLNIYQGKCVCEPVAKALDMEYVKPLV